jgi:hypothetical protein
MLSKRIFIPLVLLFAAPVYGADDAGRSGLLNLLRAPFPAHLRAVGAPVFYGQNLYEYIDGGAELFHSFDMKTLLHQEFKAGETDLTVDVYDMGTLENAFGTYAAERSPDYKFQAIGAEGYQDEGVLNFFQDRYYVKLAAFGPNAASAMSETARHLSAQIGGRAAMPDFLSRFPAEGRKTRSEIYLRAAPLGHPFLGPAFLAKYDASTVAVSIAPDAQQAAKRLAEFAEHLRKSGKVAAAPELGAGAIRGENSYEGVIVARAEGRHLVLVVNPGSRGEALLNAVCARLR